MVDSREYHALTLDAHHGAWSKVGNEEHLLAYKVFRIVPLCNAGEDGAVGAAAIVDGEVEQFL